MKRTRNAAVSEGIFTVCLGLSLSNEELNRSVPARLDGRL